jgi:hypothetical protein
MKSITFICPYFGKLPEAQFPLWLQSCAYNPSIKWIIFTDDTTEYDYPTNVEKVQVSFEWLKKYIQSKFEFKVSLDTPYKLCDFKPTYGYVFKDYLQDSDYWGYCDISDTIFGNLRKFLTDNVLTSDKVMFLGHMTLYRNSKSINSAFMNSEKCGKPIERILGVAENMAFDENPMYGIRKIFKILGYSSYRVDKMYDDISPLRYAFQLSCYDQDYKQYYKKKVPIIFEWRNGSLYEFSLKEGELIKRELGYVHFQKRKMNNLFKKKDVRQFLIVPNKFIENNKMITTRSVEDYGKDRMFYYPFFKLKWDALIYKLSHLGKD